MATATTTTVVATAVGNWATIGPLSHHLSQFYAYFLTSLPCRILLATWILWSASSSSSPSLLGSMLLIPQKRKFRQSAAILTGMVAAFCTATYLMPLMLEDDPSRSSSSSSGGSGGGNGSVTVTSTTTTSSSSNNINNNISNQHHDIELAHVALSLLSVTAAFVGAALGSLLPRVASGATLGYGMALWMGASAIMIFSGKHEGEGEPLASQVVEDQEQPQPQQHRTTNDYEYYGYDNFTALYFALLCLVAALLGGISTAR